MSWWGKVIGGAFGFMLGGPLGALLGVALGHNFDRGMRALPDGAWGQEKLAGGEKERIQTAFFTATFAVMGHIAKADGRVTQAEIRVAEEVMRSMDLNKQMRDTAIRLFNEGKSADFPLEDVLQQLRQECHGRTTLIRMFIEIQLQAAHADGELDPAEDRLMVRICGLLGISEADYRQLERMIQAEAGFGQAAGKRGPALEDAYALLGVTADTSVAEIKKSYRRLLSQHHPDKLVSKGLPEEMIKVAARKTHEIKQAYEQVKQARGF